MYSAAAAYTARPPATVTEPARRGGAAAAASATALPHGRAGPGRPSRATDNHRSPPPTTRTAPPGKNQLFLLRLFTQNRARYCPSRRHNGRTLVTTAAPTKISSVVGHGWRRGRAGAAGAGGGPQRAGRRERPESRMQWHAARRQRTNKNAASQSAPPPPPPPPRRRPAAAAASQGARAYIRILQHYNNK